MNSICQHTLFAERARIWLVVAATQPGSGAASFRLSRLLIAAEPTEPVIEAMRPLQEPALRERLRTCAGRLAKQHCNRSGIGRQFLDLVKETASQQVKEELAR